MSPPGNPRAGAVSFPFSELTETLLAPSLPLRPSRRGRVVPEQVAALLAGQRVAETLPSPSPLPLLLVPSLLQGPGRPQAGGGSGGATRGCGGWRVEAHDGHHLRGGAVWLGLEQGEWRVQGSAEGRGQGAGPPIAIPNNHTTTTTTTTRQRPGIPRGPPSRSLVSSAWAMLRIGAAPHPSPSPARHQVRPPRMTPPPLGLLRRLPLRPRWWRREAPRRRLLHRLLVAGVTRWPSLRRGGCTAGDAGSTGSWDWGRSATSEYPHTCSHLWRGGGYAWGHGVDEELGLGEVRGH